MLVCAANVYLYKNLWGKLGLMLKRTVRKRSLILIGKELLSFCVSYRRPNSFFKLDDGAGSTALLRQLAAGPRRAGGGPQVPGTAATAVGLPDPHQARDGAGGAPLFLIGGYFGAGWWRSRLLA
jgi:hypothetical protein